MHTHVDTVMRSLNELYIHRHTHMYTHTCIHSLSTRNVHYDVRSSPYLRVELTAPKQEEEEEEEEALEEEEEEVEELELEEEEERAAAVVQPRNTART